MVVIISDTGPLLALAGVDQLNILQELFKTVLIPEAVQSERIAKQDSAAQHIEIAIQQGWLEVRQAPCPQDFPVSLGDGEQEAMQLATQLQNAMLIMDDRLARREALHRNLAFVGTAKILWTAQQRGIIPSAALLINAMAANGYHISAKLLEQFQ